MRSAACLVVAVAIAACSANGVTIEVHRGATGAERVELYIVDGFCTTDAQGEQPCPRLKTPSATRYLDGEVYTRKIGDTFEAPVESDGVAYFSIKANGDRTRIPLAVAVGFDANGTRVGAALMPREFYTTDNNRHLVTLEAIVEDKVNGTAQSDGLRAETWYDDPVGCLALEHTSSGTSERMFVVPADDLDCDGWLPPEECDSIWPNHGPDDDDSTLAFTCTLEESVSGSGEMCLLGDAPCIDGQGAPECKAVATNGHRWCVPSSVCDPICKDSTNPLCLYGALKNPMMQPLNHASYVHCKVPVEQSLAGGGDTLQVCRGNVAADFLTTFEIPANTTCSDFAIGPVTATQIGPFSPVRSSTVGPLNTIRAELQDPCTLSLQFSGTFDSTTLANALPDLALKLDVSPTLSVVVPFVISLEPLSETACANATPRCVLEVADPDANGIDESLAACFGGG